MESQLLVGNVFYFWLARRLARKEGRTDVTAMPYGPSVPHMFIVTFVIMLPTFLQTKDPVLAWEAGLAWSFIIGIIILIGAFVGPVIRKYTPRAALLGTLAGISITFIAMNPAARMWEATWISLPVLGLIIIGFIANVRLPGGVPMGLVALLLGTTIAWIGGYMSVDSVSDSVEQIAVGLPSLNFDLLFNGLEGISPLLATAIPLGIYNFTEAMSNVESAAAAGDKYNLRSVLLADGTGAVVGSCLGCPFPPAVYVGQPGWKAAGGRAGYSLATGVLIFVLCAFGLFPLLGAILPMPAIVPILLFIGLVIGAQAFAAVPKAHYAAIVLATIPNIAAWGSGLIDNALAATGTTAAEVGAAALTNAGARLRRAAHAGGGRGARGHGARRDRGVPHRPQVPVGGRLRGVRRGAVGRRADPRRQGRAVRRPARRAGLRVPRDRGRGVPLPRCPGSGRWTSPTPSTWRTRCRPIRTRRPGTRRPRNPPRRPRSGDDRQPERRRPRRASPACWRPTASDRSTRSTSSPARGSARGTTARRRGSRSCRARRSSAWPSGRAARTCRWAACRSR